jgi:hypothetical protein
LALACGATAFETEVSAGTCPTSADSSEWDKCYTFSAGVALEAASTSVGLIKSKDVAAINKGQGTFCKAKYSKFPLALECAVHAQVKVGTSNATVDAIPSGAASKDYAEVNANGRLSFFIGTTEVADMVDGFAPTIGMQYRVSASGKNGDGSPVDEIEPAAQVWANSLPDDLGLGDLANQLFRQGVPAVAKLAGEQLKNYLGTISIQGQPLDGVIAYPMKPDDDEATLSLSGPTLKKGICMQKNVYAGDSTIYAAVDTLLRWVGVDACIRLEPGKASKGATATEGGASLSLIADVALFDPTILDTLDSGVEMEKDVDALFKGFGLKNPDNTAEDLTVQVLVDFLTEKMGSYASVKGPICEKLGIGANNTETDAWVCEGSDFLAMLGKWLKLGLLKLREMIQAKMGDAFTFVEDEQNLGELLRKGIDAISPRRQLSTTDGTWVSSDGEFLLGAARTGGSEWGTPVDWDSSSPASTAGPSAVVAMVVVAAGAAARRLL